MVLKEAYRYLKFLNCLHAEILNKVRYDSDVTFVTIKSHLKNDVIPSIPNIDEIENEDYEYKLDVLIRLDAAITAEHEFICAGVKQAKASAIVDPDLATQTNIMRRESAEALKKILASRGDETSTKGQSYVLDSNGIPNPYTYEMKIVTRLRFDPQEIRRNMKDILSIADNRSTTIEELLSTIELDSDVKPRFDVNDTFDDIYIDFANN